MKHIQTYYRTCNLCEAMCGLVITTQGGRIDKIIGDEKDPLSHGHICPKALAYKDLHEDPDRLKFPAKKTPSGWGHEVNGTQQHTAHKQLGENLNALGDETAIDPISGNADLVIRDVSISPI